MATDALNTKLQIELTSNVWTDIAEISSLDLSGITVDIEETTSLNSGDFKEFAPGYNDAGTLNVSLFFSNVEDSQMAQRSQRNSPHFSQRKKQYPFMITIVGIN